MFKRILAQFVDLSPVSSETVNHLFYECSHTEQFLIWKDFKYFLYALSGKHVENFLQDVLVDK